MADHEPMVEVVPCEGGHYRWVCQCGSKGIRLAFRASVEALADKHRAKHA